MAKKTGRRKLKPISQRGKGERRITMQQSRKKANASGYKAPAKRKGANAAAKKAVGAVNKTRRSTKLALINSKVRGGGGSSLKTRLKQKALNTKSKLKIKTKAATKRATKIGSNLSFIGSVVGKHYKKKAKNTLGSAKNKVKRTSFKARVGARKLTAAHRKAISMGLRKRFGKK